MPQISSTDRSEGNMKVLKRISKHFKKKPKISTEKMTPEERRDSDSAMVQHSLESRRRSSETNVLDLRRQEHLEKMKELSERKAARSRCQTMSCNSYFTMDRESDSIFLKDPRLTENAKKLTAEQRQALELDIFKPLDFYEILFNRMKAKDDGEASEEEQETESTEYSLF